MFSRLLGFMSADMAIDLGTANTLVYDTSARHRIGRATRSSLIAEGFAARNTSSRWARKPS